MHTTGMGGLIALMFIMSFTSTFDVAMPFMFILIIAGIVGTSRFILEAHNPAEVYGGYMLGFACQMIAVNYLSS